MSFFELYKQQKFTDLVIREINSKETKEYKVHKLVLYQSIGYVKTFLDSDVQKDKGVLEIHTDVLGALSFIIEFVYGSCLPTYLVDTLFLPSQEYEIARLLDFLDVDKDISTKILRQIKYMDIIKYCIQESKPLLPNIQIPINVNTDEGVLFNIIGSLAVEDGGIGSVIIDVVKRFMKLHGLEIEKNQFGNWVISGTNLVYVLGNHFISMIQNEDGTMRKITPDEKLTLEKAKNLPRIIRSEEESEEEYEEESEEEEESEKEEESEEEDSNEDSEEAKFILRMKG